MNLNTQLSKNIFDSKYPGMEYENYVLLVEEGFEILKTNDGTINTHSSLQELKAIRMALEYRISSLSFFRKNQLKKALGGSSMETYH
jgi:hypothetical protein